ncbi:MAG: alpha/beta hydrolase [Phycisphaerales bacterium]|nr:alpha/beta hydrolase [Planctomycetota bacterium]
MRNPLPLLVAGLLAYGVVLVWLTYRRLTRPRRRTYSWALANNLPGDPGELTPALEFVPFEFTSRGRRLKAWDVRGLKAPGPTVVLTHGWSESKVVMLSRLGILAPLASRLILWDLPGHGDSQGVCTLGLEEKSDLLALLDAANIDGELILYGFSLGAGLCLEAGERADAVIAEAPYRLEATPAKNVMAARGMPSRWNLSAAVWLVARLRGRSWAGFDRVLAARSLECPLLVLWGARDVVTPRADAEEIAEAGRGTFVPVPDATHSRLWRDAASADCAGRAVSDFVSTLAGR